MEQELREWVQNYLGRILGVTPLLIDMDMTLHDYGLDSVDAVLMAGELEEAFSVEIDPGTFLQYPTLAAMVTGLASELGPRPPKP